jgi:hypothetical protein
VIRLSYEVQPFRLSRKRQRWEEAEWRKRCAAPVRTITAIEPEGDAEMVCISVAAADGLFAINDFILTHNTTALAAPQVLAAPGAVVATSNKVDLWALTHTARARRGRCWVFDPQRIALVTQTWWWNPLGA